MVEDDVEDDFDSRLVERLHKLLEFPDRAARRLVRRERRFRGEEPDCRVSPIVLHARARHRVHVRVLVFVELKYGKKLNRGDSKLLQVGNLLLESRVCSRMLHLRRGGGGEPFEVRLVDYRFSERDFERHVVAPVERFVVDDDVFRHLLERPRLVGKQVPENRTSGKTFRLRVKKMLLPVEAVPVRRIERSFRAVQVERARLEPLDENVPDVSRLVRLRAQLYRLERLR